MTELLAEVGGLGGTGTIDNALKGGDVKAGIRLYKLLFEAVYRIKLRNKVFTNGENELTQQISNAKQNMNMQNIDILMKNPRLVTLMEKEEGEMAHWMDSFLEMVDIMLNVIHFQRTGN